MCVTGIVVSFVTSPISIGFDDTLSNRSTKGYSIPVTFSLVLDSAKPRALIGQFRFRTYQTAEWMWIGVINTYRLLLSGRFGHGLDVVARIGERDAARDHILNKEDTVDSILWLAKILFWPITFQYNLFHILFVDSAEFTRRSWKLV